MSSVGLWKRKSKSVIRESKVGRRDGRLAGERVVGSACSNEGVSRARERSACGSSCRLWGGCKSWGGSGRLAEAGRSVYRSPGFEAGESSEYNKVNCNDIEQSVD